MNTFQQLQALVLVAVALLIAPMALRRLCCLVREQSHQPAIAPFLPPRLVLER